MFYKGATFLGSPDDFCHFSGVPGKNKAEEEVERCPAVHKQAHYLQLSSHCTVLPSNLRTITEVMKVL